MSLKHFAEDDQPREKFLLKGKQAVSDSELLAIIMGSGNREESAVDLGRRILESVGNNWHRLSQLSLQDFMKFKGVGEAKAISIAAALEIGKRRASQEIPVQPKVRKSKDLYFLLSPFLEDLKTEEFWAVYLNQDNKVIYKSRLTQGGINQSIVDVRVLFSEALNHFATAVVIAHNHPSGNLEPSINDRNITEKIKSAGKILDIQLLDHIIIGKGEYFSFADANIL